MIYIAVYGTVFLIILLSFCVYKHKSIMFFIRLRKCKTYKNNITKIHIEKTLENHQQIIDAVMNKIIKFVACLNKHNLDSNKTVNKLKKCDIYILEGILFYYPPGAVCNDGERYYNLTGVYSRRFNFIALEERHSALTWELKNLYNSVSGDRTQYDPDPDDIGIGGCV